MWLTLDEVTRESSGLEFVRGSHRWPNRFKAVSPMYNEQLMNPAHEEAPSIEERREDYDILSWDMEPGDMLIFHPLTLHGSGGNHHVDRKRRALAFRWLGDDVVYAPTPYTMPYPVTGIAEGEPIGEPSFAQILPVAAE
jgi:ectoine hydroxylase-related dioxygenase (phytanoyl-CoA dioxygenase family)